MIEWAGLAIRGLSLIHKCAAAVRYHAWEPARAHPGLFAGEGGWSLLRGRAMFWFACGRGEGGGRGRRPKPTPAQTSSKGEEVLTNQTKTFTLEESARALHLLSNSWPQLFAPPAPPHPHTSSLPCPLKPTCEGPSEITLHHVSVHKRYGTSHKTQLPLRARKPKACLPFNFAHVSIRLKYGACHEIEAPLKVPRMRRESASPTYQSIQGTAPATKSSFLSAFPRPKYRTCSVHLFPAPAILSPAQSTAPSAKCCIGEDH